MKKAHKRKISAALIASWAKRKRAARRLLKKPTERRSFRRAP